MVHKTIEEILIKKYNIQPNHIVEAKALSEGAKILWEHILVQKRLITEEQLAQVFSQAFDLPFVERITDKMVEADLLAQISIKFLREHLVIPLAYDGRKEIVIANPYDFQTRDEIYMIFSDASFAVAPPSIILDAINRYYPLEGTKEMIQELEDEGAFTEGMTFDTIQEEDILGMASEAPIIKLVNHIFYQAVKREASDIHIEPFEKELRIRYRIDGVLYPALMPPKRVQAALSSRIKIMANLNIAEKRQPQDGRIQIKVADKPIDLRVSILPVTHGERIVLRLLDKSKTFGELKNLGLSERDYRVMDQSINQPNGIMLVTGPTGSGKTSTLYSILHELNDPNVNIVTVEDPVEYQMKGIGQVQVKDKIGLNFAAALRSILRQDPDVVMIGETRDQETAQIAIQAALTGHLVLSTLHTNSAAASITRLIDMGIEPFLIASTVVSVIAQRLVRKLCIHCKNTYKPDGHTLKRVGISSQVGSTTPFYQAQGCDECMMTGYKGRLAIFEVMVMTPAIARLTLERADTMVIQEQARKEGMSLLVEDGVSKAQAGLTTLEEVLSVAASQEGVM